MGNITVLSKLYESGNIRRFAMIEVVYLIDVWIKTNANSCLIGIQEHVVVLSILEINRLVSWIAHVRYCLLGPIQPTASSTILVCRCQINTIMDPPKLQCLMARA